VVAGVLLASCSDGSNKASPPTTAANQAANEVDRLLATGVNQAETRHFAQAETTFQDVLTLVPGNEYAWYNLGLIAETENDPTQAISDYQQAIKADPRDTSAMYNEAITLEPTDRQQALLLYKQVVAIDPKAATAYLRMSFLYDELGDRTAAAAARNKATAIEPQLRSVPPPES
jgi:Tfp pilus assembly protein PilF